MGRKSRRPGSDEPRKRRGKRRSIRYDAVHETPEQRRARGPAAPVEINLRRMRAEEALNQLQAQLTAFSKMGKTEVLVVHGRGHNSPGGRPVLKDLVRQWCENHPGLVKTWREAPSEWGGQGAIVVVLR